MEVLVILKFNRKMIKDKFLDLLVGINLTLVSFFMPVYYKKWKDTKKIKFFNKSLDVDTEIKKIIAAVRVKHGFNRSSIVDYHNGTTSLGGFSFKNSSMRYEDCDEHTKYISMEFQNIPCSIITDMLLRLERSEKGYVSVTDDQNETSDEQSVITHRMYGIRQAYNFRIGTSLIYGCLSLVSTDQKIRLSEDDIIDIKAACQKIFLLRNK
jgi:hypothetical protein